MYFVERIQQHNIYAPIPPILLQKNLSIYSSWKPAPPSKERAIPSPEVIYERRAVPPPFLPFLLLQSLQPSPLSWRHNQPLVPGWGYWVLAAVDRHRKRFRCKLEGKGRDGRTKKRSLFSIIPPTFLQRGQKGALNLGEKSISFKKEKSRATMWWWNGF